MSTLLMRASLYLHSETFDRFFWSYPVMWNSTCSQFLIAPKDLTRKFLTYFVLSIQIVQLILSLFLLTKEFFHRSPDFPIIPTFYGIFTSVGTTFALYGRCFLFRYFSHELITSMNGIHEIEKTLARGDIILFKQPINLLIKHKL